MNPLPDIHFQVPSVQEGMNHWAWLDQNKSEFTVNLRNSQVSHRLSATQLRALTLLLENSMENVPHKEFVGDPHHGGTMSVLRYLFACAIVHGKVEKHLLIPEEIQCRMQDWLRGRQHSYTLMRPAFQGRNISRRDRLFRALSSGLLSRPETMGSDTAASALERPPIGRQYGRKDEFRHDPELRTVIAARRNLEPVLLIFAAETAVVNKAGIRQILRPREAAKSGWKPTLDELTGDTVSVSILSSHIAGFGFALDAFAPAAAAGVLKEARVTRKLRPLLFVGSAYANTVLRDIEDQSFRAYPFGARFDYDAPLLKKGLRVTFKSETCTGEWFEKHHMERSRDIAVIRRWRTADGCEAILAAGMTAQGTLGAVRFLCDEKSIDELFKYLAPDDFHQNMDDVEAMQFDVILGVPLDAGIAVKDLTKIAILAGSLRRDTH